MTTTHLNGHHRTTLASIFRHPVAHNVEWHDVISLLDNVGTTNKRHSGGYDVTIGSEHYALSAPHGKDVAGDDLRDLQAFLTKAGVGPDTGSTVTTQEVEPAPRPCIVLINHHEARLFGLGANEGDPATPTVVVPDDPDGSLRRIEHRQGNDDHDGGHTGEDEAYYERIATHLAAAPKIVLLSDGKGRSSAGEYFIGFLKRHHPDVLGNIVATDRVDIAHLSDGEVLAAGLALIEAG
jgi:hypothetical protein